jgi:ribonuclease HI
LHRSLGSALAKGERLNYNLDMTDTWTIYTDGGSRGNPGPAAYAYVIKRPGQPDIEEKAYLGQTTNNIAEYTGIVKALEHALELGGKKLIVNSDSELMVKQMSGQYKVKNEGLRPLYQQAVALRKQFESVVIKHVYREQNSQADALCNEAMDDRAPMARAGSRTVAKLPESMPTKEFSVTPLMKALDLMKESARQWAKHGNPKDPAPGEVLSRIIEILESARPPAAD